ncbi:hypothetical protein EJ05DRAFT_135974 [Pseudovirgaria hyperparasitica]|uniref:Uncharacterized protein n=1 Tax=Pseudovirgaria hyperparasitica TaxID=470096 RepID=A0A6A6VXF5_9PEZI|nr:uncharacterized protein EJ05DRAFT_135974 [Pseudovirgaria hyperparasitica]KAF2754855.1 hypothetical protein EJ05DRAFT_135974 [Pseudovirgaria hyperparasitica]
MFSASGLMSLWAISDNYAVPVPHLEHWGSMFIGTVHIYFPSARILRESIARVTFSRITLIAPVNRHCKSVFNVDRCEMCCERYAKLWVRRSVYKIDGPDR